VDNATRGFGIDLNRRRWHIAVIDEQGELTTSSDRNDREVFLELLGVRRRDARGAGGDLWLGVAGRAARGGRL
jgi:hypothetical protein